MLVGVTALCAILATSLFFLRHQKYSVRTKQITEGVYLFAATGLNALAVVADDGVILVDTMKNGWWGPALESALRRVTDKPVRTIINTNSHPSHSGNNFRFAGEGTVVVAHEQTRARLQARDNFRGAQARYLPQTTFRDRLTLTQGSERVDLYYFGASNTDGDAWVVFPSRRVMHIGDVVKKNEFLEITPNSGGSGLSYAQTMARGIATIQNVDVVITGHGYGEEATLPWSELGGYQSTACDLVDAVQKAMTSNDHVEAVVSIVQGEASFNRYDPIDIASAVRSVHAELKGPRQSSAGLSGEVLAPATSMAGLTPEPAACP